jgi:hypothetical protein
LMTGGVFPANRILLKLIDYDSIKMKLKG